MAISREAIQAALFTRLQAKLTGVKTWSRVFRDASEVPANEQPAVICVAEGYTPRNSDGEPPIWAAETLVVLYARNATSTTGNTTPETVLLNLVDQVETALERDTTEAAPMSRFNTSLGIPSVSRAWISDKVQIYQGAEGGQLIALIPIEMQVNA